MKRRNVKATKPIAEEIAELRGLRVPDLVVRYEAVYGKPPRVKHREHLWRRIAWKVQEQRFGGLSGAAKRKLDGLIAEIDMPLVTENTQLKKPIQRVDGEPQLGTVLVRLWRDQEIHATRTDQGWEHNGVVYRSLTAVAKAVTGSHWNGRLFFGLATRGATA